MKKVSFELLSFFHTFHKNSFISKNLVNNEIASFFWEEFNFLIEKLKIVIYVLIKFKLLFG